MDECTRPLFQLNISSFVGYAGRSQCISDKTVQVELISGGVKPLPHMHTLAVTMRLQKELLWLVKRHDSRMGAV